MCVRKTVTFAFIYTHTFTHTHTQSDWQMCEKCMIKDVTRVPVGPAVEVFTQRCRKRHILRAFARRLVDQHTLSRGCGKCNAPLGIPNQTVMDAAVANDPVYTCYQCHENTGAVDWYCSSCFDQSSVEDPLTQPAPPAFDPTFIDIHIPQP